MQLSGHRIFSTQHHPSKLWKLCVSLHRRPPSNKRNPTTDIFPSRRHLSMKLSKNLTSLPLPNSVPVTPRAQLAEVVTNSLDITTIVIGSGDVCDGQVLGYHNRLGILSHPHHAKVAPKFSKMFADVCLHFHGAIGEYCRQVKGREFPSDEYSPNSIGDEEFAEFFKEAEKKSARGRRNTTRSKNGSDDGSSDE